jgi:hypothetical protein
MLAPKLHDVAPAIGAGPVRNPPVPARRRGMTDDPLAALIAWAAACGVAGLLGVTLLERLVPILPSYGLLVAIGIAAAGAGRFRPRSWRRPWAVSADALPSTF